MSTIETPDKVESQDWLESIDLLVEQEGIDYTESLLKSVLARRKVLIRETNYLNTIDSFTNYPGDKSIEEKISSYARWNAAAMVLKAQQFDSSLGGHIGSFASSALMYEVGHMHFWRASNHEQMGDLIFYQGHISPGIYALSFLNDQLEENQLNHFRREVKNDGLSSYPHPYLMPNYWQFPTVSMGLGPLQAIYQARFMRYLENRGLTKDSDRKVWCFCGDGEMDEPESLGALSIAAREKLNNLIFVINCNLQRLDGPVRGNSKIIQELEAYFAGAGWNVVKVLWSSDWDKLFQADPEAMSELLTKTVDGQYQTLKASNADYIRNFFSQEPKLAKVVAEMSDAELMNLRYAGHERDKIYAAYQKAASEKNRPSVILVKTVKGYGLGKAGESMNTAHNAKKMSIDDRRVFRDRFELPLSDKDLEDIKFLKFDKDSDEFKYLRKHRDDLGGPIPARRVDLYQKLKFDCDHIFNKHLSFKDDRELSTTMAWVRLLADLLKDKNIGKNVVPIVPDESRTFGMESLFRQIGIYAADGQKYESYDSKQILSYVERKNGQLLQEGICEAGAMSSWIAAATSYSAHGVQTIPFYIYYSMFGLQRIGDLAWAAGDSRARGFLMGATAGRTTLNGEGLQHQDGHSHILAQTIPNMKSYDPSYRYEVAAIVEYGMKRMIVDDVDEFYYITLMNENYKHPTMPENCKEDIIKGMYLLEQYQGSESVVHILSCGTIMNEARAAAVMLNKELNLHVYIWSATSFNELARDGLDVERSNRFQSSIQKPTKIPFVTEKLQEYKADMVLAVSDYMKLYAEQIRAYVPYPYKTLGTDGFGRSGPRSELREFFEVDKKHIVHSVCSELYAQKKMTKKDFVKITKELSVDTDKLNPQYN